MLYDTEGNFIRQGIAYVTAAHRNTWLNDLSIALDIDQIDRDGTLHIFLANESSQDVFFDDFEVQHNPAPIVQENHYDPFGLNLVGIEKAGNHPNQYNAQSEKQKHPFLSGYFYETPARMYHPALGRFQGIDPFANLMPGITPYNYSINDPVNFNDPSGEILPALIPYLIGAGVGAVTNVATNWSNIRGVGSFLGYLGSGAVGGAVSVNSPFLGGAITSGTNTLLGGGSAYEAVQNGLIGGASSFAGDKIARAFTPVLAPLSNKIGSPVLRGLIGGGLGGGVTGGVLGFGTTLLTGGDWGAAFRGFGEGFATGFALGATSGAIGGYKQAKIDNVNPWTGLRNGTTIDDGAGVTHLAVDEGDGKGFEEKKFAGLESGDSFRPEIAVKINNVDDFVAGQTDRLYSKLGGKIGKGELPFEKSKQGVLDAIESVRTTLSNPTQISEIIPKSVVRGDFDLIHIYSSKSGNTVSLRVLENGTYQFDTLIPGKSSKF